MSFVLITELCGTPLNFTPGPIASLASPKPQSCLFEILPFLVKNSSVFQVT